MNRGAFGGRDFIELARRFLVIAAVAFWLGGFTFYASVVIHTGHRVFGSRLETGFLTQQVTHWLNFSGVITLTILLANGFVDWRHASRWIKSCLWLTWAIMAAVLAALYIMHPMLDRMLDIEAHRFLDRSRFHGLHAAYMNLSTTQWAVGLLHLWLTLLVWRAGPASAAVLRECTEQSRNLD
jgi:hypothetical protein